MPDYSYEIPSKDEQNKGGGTPLVAEDYIIKLAKIELGYSPRFVNNVPNYNDMQPIFKVVCLPYALKAGGQMKLIDQTDAKPLNTWIFRDISFSTGFQQDRVTPSFMRALIAYMEKTDVDARLKMPKPLLLDPAGKEVPDETMIKKAIDELNGIDASQELVEKGYKVVPDIRIYQGKYIGCALEVDRKKNRNKISKFSKLPDAFLPPTPEEETELMKGFEERYEKMKANQAAKQGGSHSNSEVVTDSLDVSNTPF